MNAKIRPLDPDEALDVRYRAGRNPAEVRGVMVALMLTGAHSGGLTGYAKRKWYYDSTTRVLSGN